ncbi:SH3 domain and tetratricopeptide repeat-containing protein 2-like isoform X2 [Manis javanica]|uniref:SH3 domain and tetratricopeptide repeat-containing protein 2-like isoform X2 n=1 Tax=Manis javanica TaxID=9974 RepID=UPI003C6D8EAE
MEEICYVSVCLEHLLFDHKYWLNWRLMENTEIQVSVDDTHLETIYLELLIQEDGSQRIIQEPVAFPGRGIGQAPIRLILFTHKAVGMADPEDTINRNVTKNAREKKKVSPWSEGRLNSDQASSEPGRGKCKALRGHEREEKDELNFQQGESIEIIGFVGPGLQWFIGKSVHSGEVGFVPTRSIDPDLLPSVIMTGRPLGCPGEGPAPSVQVCRGASGPPRNRSQVDEGEDDKYFMFFPKCPLYPPNLNNQSFYIIFATLVLIIQFFG